MITNREFYNRLLKDRNLKSFTHEEIRYFRNRHCLYKFTNYTGVRLDLKTLKPITN